MSGLSCMRQKLHVALHVLLHMNIATTALSLIKQKDVMIKILFGIKFLNCINFQKSISKNGLIYAIRWQMLGRRIIMFCQKWQVHSCENCASSCKDWNDPIECQNWKPCRGGHPSTPNPCECSSADEYDLCLGDCAGCEHIHWD